MTPTTKPTLRTLDARTPLLLLPVNVETRFVDSGNQPELWVRIYPDQISINSHEPELTAQEITDGQAYWDAVWRAGKSPASPDSVKAPWRGLASRYGAPRAAWIALQMTPTNVGLQPVAAVSANAAPVPPPVYPAPARRTSSWTRPAIASALPDAWTLVLVSGNQTASFQGSPITPDLAVGLTPGGGGFPAGSPADAGMQWLVDFNVALGVGMALKIPLTAVQRRSGFDRIFVYGLRTRGDGAGDFSSLLDAHHYTDGFALVPQGAPTNNTSDASSAYSRNDPDYEASFAAERQGPLTNDPAGDGVAFSQAIGIDPTHLAHTACANGTNVESGTDMMTALWAATLGYFLSQTMADVFTPDKIELARQYAILNAIPRGPVPAFRVGKTPYGVLPVTSLSRYKPDRSLTGGSIEPPLVDFILRLWPNWLNSSAGSPHMQNSGDPDQELAGLLGMDASSMTFRGREVLGDGFLWNYMSFLGLSGASANTWFADHLARGRQLLDSFQFQSWDPRVIHQGMSDKSFPVTLATVQTGPLSETGQLNADADLGGGRKGNYIQWLRQAAIDDIRAENYPGPTPTSLLYRILRQSVLFDYVSLSISGEIAAGRLLATQVRETEFTGIPTGTPPPQPAVSAWEVLARPSGPNPSLSWAEYLVSLDPPPASPFARLAQLRSSLDRLAALPTAELDRLLTETLDACSHRLDVWAGAIANSILSRTRAGQVKGAHLGSFGWVEEVRPAAQRASIQGADLASVRQLDALRSRRVGGAASDLAPPLEPLTDNGGFIYSPSLDQAAVAAVLRNGYMTHKGTANEGLLAVDLSSERVRKALYLLDGVRQGQNLNALLGYLFEQGLHDVHLDKYAQPFRDRFPVLANKLTPSSDPSESVAASNVVDGVALRTAWDSGQLPAGGNWGVGLPGAGADQNAVIGILQSLDDYADALGDLSMSEAVYQIMRGNFGRAGGLMDAISRGESPPEPDVIRTPRGGLDLSHRILWLFTGAPAWSPAWAGVPKHARALAEPFLDAGLSSLLPDPAKVVCEVRYHSGAGDHKVRVRLVDLRVGPLDCLTMADAAEVPQQSELEGRVLLAAAIPAGADNVQIDYAPTPSVPGTIWFPDFLCLAKSLRNVTGSARDLTPQDLTLPEKRAADQGGIVDLADLRTRATTAVSNLAADRTALQTAVAGLPGSPGPVRTALVKAGYYGVAGSIPSPITDAGLADQGRLGVERAERTSGSGAGGTYCQRVRGRGYRCIRSHLRCRLQSPPPIYTARPSHVEGGIPAIDVAGGIRSRGAGPMVRSTHPRAARNGSAGSGVRTCADAGWTVLHAARAGPPGAGAACCGG